MDVHHFADAVITLLGAIAGILILKLILSGLLKDKKETVALVTNLLLLIAANTFVFSQQAYIADNHPNKIYILWLLLAVLYIITLKDIYSFIKSKKVK